MSNPLDGCADFHRSLQVDRRSFLKAGILGTAGLSLAELLRAEAQAGAGTSIKSVIILWMRGGPSHIDMWDPKPNAPAEYRGEFGVLSTRVPGIVLCDLLPLCGQIMPKWSIVRSLYHGDAGHSSGDQIASPAIPPARIRMRTFIQAAAPSFQSSWVLTARTCLLT